MFNKIEAVGGFVLYVGVKKTASPALHSPNRLYTKVLLEAVKRIDQFCEVDCNPSANFLLALDEHDQRAALITEISRSMYAGPERRRHLIEPLFNLESHRYQTIQAADWIAGLVGRLGAIWADPDAYPENVVFRHYFEQRLNRISRRSGIRTGTGSRSPATLAGTVARAGRPASGRARSRRVAGAGLIGSGHGGPNTEFLTLHHLPMMPGSGPPSGSLHVGITRPSSGSCVIGKSRPLTQPPRARTISRVPR